MIKLLHTSLGMKARDPSWLLSHASVEMIAPGSFSGPELATGDGGRPQSWLQLWECLPWVCTALGVPHLLPSVPVPLLRLHTCTRLDLLNLPLENLHHLWGRKCSVNTEKCHVGHGVSLW